MYVGKLIIKAASWRTSRFDSCVVNNPVPSVVERDTREHVDCDALKKPRAHNLIVHVT